MYPPLIDKSYSIPYLIFFIVLVLIYYGSKSFNLRQAVKPSQWILATVLLFMLFWGFRGYICTDWVNYYQMFHENPEITNITDLWTYYTDNMSDIGYIIFTGIFKIFSQNFLAFQTFCYLIILIFMYKIIRKYSADFILSFILTLVFFIIQPINLMRNVFAILLFLYSIQFIQSKQFGRYLILNLIGVLFHKTAILFIPLYFIIGHKYSVKKLICFFIISYVIFISQINIITEFVGNIIGDTSGMIWYVLHYAQKSSPKLFSIGSLERLFTTFLVLYYYDRIWAEYKYGGYFANILLLYLLSYLWLFEVTVLVIRISQLFSFAYVIFYADIFDILKKSKYLNLYRFTLLGYVAIWMSITFSALMYRYDNSIMGFHQSYDERMNLYNYYGALEYMLANKNN